MCVLLYSLWLRYLLSVHKQFVKSLLDAYKTQLAVNYLQDLHPFLNHSGWDRDAKSDRLSKNIYIYNFSHVAAIRDWGIGKDVKTI